MTFVFPILTLCFSPCTTKGVEGYWCPKNQGLLLIKKPLGCVHPVYMPISPLIALGRRKFRVSVIFVSRSAASFPMRHELLFRNVSKHEATRYYWALSPAFFFKLFLFAHTLSPACLQSEKIKQTPHVQCSPDSQMTQYCFDSKVRLLLSIKGQTFISARSAEGCREEFFPSVSRADLIFPLQSLTESLLATRLFSPK